MTSAGRDQLEPRRPHARCGILRQRFLDFGRVFVRAALSTCKCLNLKRYFWTWFSGRLHAGRHGKRSAPMAVPALRRRICRAQRRAAADDHRARGRAAEAALYAHLRSRRCGPRARWPNAWSRSSASCARKRHHLRARSTTWATTTSGPPTAPSASTSRGTWRTHAVAAGERSPVRVLARRGADVPAPRGRPRDQLRLRAVAPARLDADLRRLPPPVPRRLQPEPVEPRLRPLPAPRRHVPLRAEASGRGLGRDVRRLAGPRRSTGGAATATGRWRSPSSSTSTASSSMEGACRGSAPRTSAWACACRTPTCSETVAEYFDIGDVVDKDLIEYRKDLLEIFLRRPPRKPAARARERAPAARARRTRSRPRASSSSTSSPGRPPLRWIGDSDKRVILRFLRQLQALCTARAHGRARQPPHREARRADRRRDLARRRRDPPTELTGGVGLVDAVPR